VVCLSVYSVRLNVVAVCQKQIAVPNNSLLYCSEKCRRADALSSSPPVFHRSASAMTLCDLQSSPTAKFTTLEPSRKDSWGITPSPAHESSPVPIQCGSHQSSSTSGSPNSRAEVTSRANSRPLPPLHPRPFGTSPRSMDLVWPVYREQLSKSAPSESKSLDYPRRIVQGDTSDPSGGLKKLFYFKELQADPNAL
jgi:ECL1/2/3 zinc binding proteins